MHLQAIVRHLSCKLILLAVSMVMQQTALAQRKISASNSSDSTIAVPTLIKSNLSSLRQKLSCFDDDNKNHKYTVTLCADLPDNNNFKKLHVGDETGHVFLIFERTDPENNDSTRQVFGFYPRFPVSCIIFRKAKSEILDNGNREYNAYIRKEISKDEFRLLLNTSIRLSAKKYNINKYNCYDFALEVFNSIPGIDKLPVKHIRFPFIFGKGGSPCGLYQDLITLKNSASEWSEHIGFGIFKSPISTR